MGIKFPEYDLFSVGENWQLVKSESFIVGVNDEAVKFEKGVDVKIIDIIRTGAYGRAFVGIDGYSFYIGLDELYAMVWD